MALDHRILETMLDGPRTEPQIMRDLGYVGTGWDWDAERLRQRLKRLADAARVRLVAVGEGGVGVWVLLDARGHVFMTPAEKVAI